MENKERYKHLNNYLKEKFGERTLKICIDGGFTCPNRDGKISYSGCIFCSAKGSGELIPCTSGKNQIEKIHNQINNYFESYRSKRAEKFIAYFQNFTNTYDTLENLKAKYDAALINDKIVGLQIATRPDCINEDIVKLISSYKKDYYVCVELGLQTSNDVTGNLINRGFSSSDFSLAVSLLNKYGIDVVAHIMVGLPNESFDNIKATVDFINLHNIQGIKIHSTYIAKNTVLADMYYSGKYSPISFDFYMDCLVYVLTHISPDVVVHRICADCPNDLLVAPEWNLHKKWVLNGLDRIMCKQDLWQGMFFSC